MDESSQPPTPQSFAALRASVPLSDRPLVRFAGVGMLLAGLLVLMVVVTSNLMGPPPPGDSLAYLQSVAARPNIAVANFILFSLSDLLVVLALPGLFLAFRRVAWTPLLVALGLIAVYLVVDLAVTELNSLVLVTLARHLTAATSNTEQLAYLSAAGYALATLPPATFFSYLVSSAGFLIVVLVMLRWGFSRWISVLGIVAFGLGIVAAFYIFVPVLALLLIPCLVAFGLWLVLGGVRLYQLGAPVPSLEAGAEAPV